MDVFISSYATSSNFVQESASLYLYDQEIIPRSDEWMSISALFEESAQLACEVNRFSLTCLDPKGDISTAIYDPNDSSSTLTLDSGSERCAPFVSFLHRLSSGYADYKYAETGDQSAEQQAKFEGKYTITLGASKSNPDGVLSMEATQQFEITLIADCSLSVLQVNSESVSEVPLTIRAGEQSSLSFSEDLFTATFKETCMTDIDVVPVESDITFTIDQEAYVVNSAILFNDQLPNDAILDGQSTGSKQYEFRVANVDDASDVVSAQFDVNYELNCAYEMVELGQAQQLESFEIIQAIDAVQTRTIEQFVL